MSSESVMSVSKKSLASHFENKPENSREVDSRDAPTEEATTAGYNAMLRIRRTRRLLALLLFLGFVSYLLHHSTTKKQLPVEPPPKEPRYLSQPIYEWTSYYRVTSNKTLEETVNSKLLAFEQKIRNSLPAHEKSLQAERVIWQIATPKEAVTWGKWISQWRDNNEEWAYHIYTAPLAHLLSLFDTIPEIKVAYVANPTIRADLIRYLLLWYYGGFYADVDTWARQGMRDCKPIQAVLEDKHDVSLMIGVDHDEPYLSTKVLEDSGWSKGFRFGQYVTWAPKRFDPILRTAIVRSVSHAMIPKAKHTWRAKRKTKADYHEELCGAGMFTDVVLEALSASLKEGHKLRDWEAGLDRRVTWKKFRALKETLWIDPRETQDGSEDIMRGLAVLPINVWGNSQNHSRSMGPDSDEACVNFTPGRRPSRTWQNQLAG